MTPDTKSPAGLLEPRGRMARWAGGSWKRAYPPKRDRATVCSEAEKKTPPHRRGKVRIRPLDKGG
jgi:hypothetical protein